MLAKFENGQLQFLPRTYTYEGVTISNYNLLPEETLLSHGWKPFIETPMPETTDDVGYNVEYVDEGDKIVTKWVAYDLPVIPSDESAELVE